MRTLAQLYPVESVMTFGGEPLLFPDTVCAVHAAAAESGIPRRQLITNGYFSKEPVRIREVAEKLHRSGVNSLFLSVDTFHRESIPLERVRPFAEAVLVCGIPGFKLHPVWVSGENNRYNRETEECLAFFSDLGIPISKGNLLFPAGGAAENFPELFEKKPVDLDYRCGQAHYTERLDDVCCLSIGPSGDVAVCCFVIGNVLREDIRDIVARYDPWADPAMAALLRGGVRELMDYAQTQGIHTDTDGFYSACGVCRDLAEKLGRNK